jgi:hypothetical protein
VSTSKPLKLLFLSSWYKFWSRYSKTRHLCLTFTLLCSASIKNWSSSSTKRRIIMSKWAYQCVQNQGFILLFAGNCTHSRRLLCSVDQDYKSWWRPSWTSIGPFPSKHNQKHPCLRNFSLHTNLSILSL